MDVIESAMLNPILVGKIADCLRFTSLKTCRSLNSLWYEEVTRVLRKKSVILVSRDTIPEIMNNDPHSKEIFSKGARINTSFSLGDTAWLLNFFPVYAPVLEFIEWTDSGAICHHGREPDDLDWNGKRMFGVSMGWNYHLSKLTELNLLPTYSFADNLALILMSAPNLRILRVHVLEYDSYCMNEFLTALQSQTELRNLKTLHFGQNTFLDVGNVRMLIELPNLELEEFRMEGRMMRIQNGWVFKAILERWSQTLETVAFRTVLPFKLSKIMSKLKTLSAATFRLKRTLPINIQFPSLQSLDVDFDSNFKFEEFIPENMEVQESMRELSLMGSRLDVRKIPRVMRMLEKFTNLRSLSIPTTDQFLLIIYTSCPNLRELYLRGTFTDVGVTGIPKKNLDIFYGILMATGNVVGEDVIQRRGVRSWSSILDLTKLEVLSLASSLVGDKSVLWGILQCKYLKKLYLPENVTDKSLDGLIEMKELRELSIPSPHEGNISFEAMRKFSAQMIHVQLRCGTNHSNLNGSFRGTH